MGYKFDEVKITWGGVDMTECFSEDHLLTIKPPNDIVMTGDAVCTVLERTAICKYWDCGWCYHPDVSKPCEATCNDCNLYEAM